MYITNWVKKYIRVRKPFFFNFLQINQRCKLFLCLIMKYFSIWKIGDILKIENVHIFFIFSHPIFIISFHTYQKELKKYEMKNIQKTNIVKLWKTNNNVSQQMKTTFNYIVKDYPMMYFCKSYIQLGAIWKKQTKLNPFNHASNLSLINMIKAFRISLKFCWLQDKKRSKIK